MNCVFDEFNLLALSHALRGKKPREKERERKRKKKSPTKNGTCNMSIKNAKMCRMFNEKMPFKPFKPLSLIIYNSFAFIKII